MMQRSFYEILGIGSDASNTEIKRAYKAMLLESHPDKSALNYNSNTNNKSSPSVNDIQEAYQTLIDQNLRKHYDEKLAESFKKLGFHNAGDGLDLFSLDLFDYSGDEQSFSMNCPRCQITDGFQLTEDALEEHAIDYEGGGYFVLVQCSACSLWLKVLFDVIEE
ncbi:Jjj3 [Kluyveromyces lactis]|nr:Jjj3 [Kluyveromyces lactis]